MANNGDYSRYFEILEISENASSEDLRKAFLRACKKHHTDMGGDKEKFHEVIEANEFLRDLYLRRRATTELSVRIRIFKGVRARLAKSRASALAVLEKAVFVFMN